MKKIRRLQALLVAVILMIAACMEPCVTALAGEGDPVFPQDGGPYMYGNYIQYFIVDGGAVITSVLGETQYTNLTIPTSFTDGADTVPVKKVGTGAISELNNLTSLEVPAGIEMEAGAVSGCSNLKTVIPESRLKDDWEAFADCPKLDVKIPKLTGKEGWTVWNGGTGETIFLEDLFDKNGSVLDSASGVIRDAYSIYRVHMWEPEYTLPTRTQEGELVNNAWSARIVDMTGCQVYHGGNGGYERKGQQYAGSMKSITIPEGYIDASEMVLCFDQKTDYGTIDIYVASSVKKFGITYISSKSIGTLRIHAPFGSAAQEYCENYEKVYDEFPDQVVFVGEKMKLKSVYMPISEIAYTGKPVKAMPLVYDTQNKRLTEGVDFTVSYSGDCIEPREYLVTVTGIGNYEGTLTAKFTIPQPPHTHAFADTWSSDASAHWKVCTSNDGAKQSEEAHTWKEIIDKAATASAAGSKHEECSVCGYKKEAVQIPKLAGQIKDTNKNASIKVSKPGTVKDGEVTGAEAVYTKPAASKATVSIPEAVTVNGVSYAVTSVAKNAFKDDKKLKNVTIGKNVSKIGANAFSGCKKLKTITFKSDKVPSIGKNALSGLPKNAVIKVPKKQYNAYKKKLTAKTGFKSTMKIKKI